MTEGRDKQLGGDALAPGGAGAKFSENVDLSNPKDAGLARQIMTRSPRRWRLSDEDRERFARNAMAAQDMAINAADVPSFAAVGRLIVSMEGQNQTDDLDAAKNKRLDNGDATENLVFIVKPPRVIGQGDA
jgi:hypothetical protein